MSVKSMVTVPVGSDGSLGMGGFSTAFPSLPSDASRSLYEIAPKKYLISTSRTLYASQLNAERRLMPRPVMLGIVGDSGSGKTTITRGLVRVLGEDQISAFTIDDYHRYDRRQRAERNITPLDPECNHLDILAQHLTHLRNNDPIMKPVYQHTDGTFGAPD